MTSEPSAGVSGDLWRGVGGRGEIINMGSPGSATAVVNRQQSTKHPPRQDADSQDDQTSLKPYKNQAEAPPKQEAGHRHQAYHHRGGAGQHRQRGPGGRPSLQMKRIQIAENILKMHSKGNASAQFLMRSKRSLDEEEA